MLPEAELLFLRRLLDRLNVQVLRFPADAPPEVDLGLRRQAGLPPFPPFSTLQPNAIYLADDDFSCRYICTLLPDTGEALLIGPYLHEEMTDEAIIPLLDRLHLPPRLLPALRRYYCSLALLHNGVMEALLATLGETLFGRMEAFSVQHTDFSASTLVEPADVPSTEPFEARLLEERYAYERRLLQAVSLGRTQEATGLIAMAGQTAIESRASDPVRNFKNYAIIMNTLLRKAVEAGGVHPLYIDGLSRQYAFRIEALQSAGQSRQLFLAMVKDYCALVNARAMPYRSAPVRDAILHMDADLTADLSLHALAQRLNISPGHLSLLFRRETGSTLTDFVTRRRMDRAAFLLASTDLQVQAVGMHCGMPDANYFCKTFKRYMGKTPRDYRASARRA